MKKLTLLIVLCSLFLAGCDLFTGPQTDLLSKINDEVAWANAEKLTVRFEYPAEWGTSSPQQGPLANPGAMDIRKGYAFTVEFTPDTAYSLNHWRAFAGRLPEGWTENFDLLEEAEEITDSGVIEFPAVNPRGGAAAFTINTASPVTIIPDCRTEPRIIRTEPRLTASTKLSRAATIIFHFNAELNESSVEGNVFITSSDDDDLSGHYDIEYYFNRGASMIILGAKSDNLPPQDTIIHVTLKGGEDGVKNIQGEFLARDETYSWTTGSVSDANITAWSATYNEAQNCIDLTWTITGTYDRVDVHYSENRGMKNPANTTTKIIGNVGRIDTSGIRGGGETGNIREYAVFIDVIVDGLAEDGASFKIWNIPGMKVSKADPLIEIGTAAEFASVSGSGTYVLTGDITIPNTTHTAARTPISSFTGKFYGNGHTVTINGMVAAENMGLFGSVSGDTALIRDLCVRYGNGITPVSVSRTGVGHFGGIAGQTTGKARLENVLVKGAFTYTQDTDEDYYIGGIVGLMTGTSTVSNAYSCLNLTVEKTKTLTSTAFGHVGGIAGSMGQPIQPPTDNGDSVKVEKADVEGNITVGGSGAVSGFVMKDNIFNYGLQVGGLAGYIQGSDSGHTGMEDSNYRRGTIEVYNGAGSVAVGGAIGKKFTKGDIIRCSSTAENFIFEKTGSGQIYVGGFFGECLGSGEIINCFSDNPVTVKEQVTGTTMQVQVGGFAGFIQADISYCYAKGKVDVETRHESRIGGFAGGFFWNITASSCFASGDVIVTDQSSGQASIGGFIGLLGGDTVVSDCYALGNVTADKTQSGDFYVGGLVGRNEGTVERCFAAGSVIAHKNSGAIYAGGLAGAGEFAGTIQNSTAPGASVTATGGGTKNIGRIYGGWATGDKTNNHAYDGMRLYEHSTPGYSLPDEITAPGYIGTVIMDKTHDGKDGMDKSDGDFRRGDFWRNDPPANGTAPASNQGLGFSDKDWDFSAVRIYGHPLLKDADGRVMGGQ